MTVNTPGGLFHLLRSFTGNGPGESTRSWAVRFVGVAVVVQALAFAVPSQAFGQAVSVSPTALFLSQRERSARLTLVNEGDRAAEVEIGLAFGYAQSDSSGRVSVPLSDMAAPGEPSLIPYLRAFPRRIRLAPGQRGMVRVLVQAPADLAEGEYWARVVISSTGAQAPVEERVGQATVRLNIKSVVAVAANYRHGHAETSLEVRSATAKDLGEEVRLLLDLDRGGNAAWLGRVVAEVMGPSGDVVASAVQDVAVYRPLRWGVSIPLGQPLDEGAFVVRYSLTSERPDEEPRHLLGAPTVRGSVPIG